MRSSLLVPLAVVLLQLSARAETQGVVTNTPSETAPVILTPAEGKEPRINGPKVFGVCPGSPLLYSIPATGERPMTFAVKNLPAGLSLDSSTGRITGVLPKAGTYRVTLVASNQAGQASKDFRIVVGDTICLTPAMGWNSYNTYDVSVNQKQILEAAHAMEESGLARHGWSVITCDDGWQGARGGKWNAIQPYEGFPDIGGMVAEIHSLGLKAGIYSTPWITSYGRRIGGSSDNQDGSWSPEYAKKNRIATSMKTPFIVGKYHFAEQDARQFADWGFDYLKYDWDPIQEPDVKEMAQALRKSGRDIIFSLSNNSKGTLLARIATVSPWANSWRTTGDVHDNWKNVANSAFGENEWAAYCRPGHYNDPDMLVVGNVGWGHPHPSNLTPDEQYTQISMWSLLSAPLILGCDLRKLDPFTLSLLTNDEVLDIDQDELCKQAVCVLKTGDLEAYAKPLADGSVVVGFFNRGETPAPMKISWADLKISGPQTLRNVWSQKDLEVSDASFETPPIGRHGVILVKFTPAPKGA